MKVVANDIMLSCLLLTLITWGAIAASAPLRVFNDEWEEITSLGVLEDQGVKYVALTDVTRLFSAGKKLEPLIGRITISMLGKEIILTIGRHQLTIDGEEYVISHPPMFISGTLALPLEFLTEILPNVTGKQINLDREEWQLQLSNEPFVRADDTAAGPNALPESAFTGFRVIIDPGHGGYDMGVKSKAGLLEKDLTLTIAQRMKNILEAEADLDVHLTRSGDNSMTIAERVNFANKLRGQIYISIHFNSSPVQSSNGFSIYVNSNRRRLDGSSSLETDMFPKSSQGEKESQRFLSQSKQLSDEIANNLEEIGMTGKRRIEVSLAGINELSMPSVLVELLYLSNSQDLIILSSPEYVESMSRALCDSILAYKSTVER